MLSEPGTTKYHNALFATIAWQEARGVLTLGTESNEWDPACGTPWLRFSHWLQPPVKTSIKAPWKLGGHAVRGAITLCNHRGKPGAHSTSSTESLESHFNFSRLTPFWPQSEIQKKLLDGRSTSPEKSPPGRLTPLEWMESRRRKGKMWKWLISRSPLRVTFDVKQFGWNGARWRLLFERLCWKPPLLCWSHCCRLEAVISAHPSHKQHPLEVLDICYWRQKNKLHLCDAELRGAKATRTWTSTRSGCPGSMFPWSGKLLTHF